jgi:hypothetical protein
VVAAYKYLLPNPHGENMILHLIIQDANILLAQELK